MSQVGLRFAQGDLLLTQLSLRPFTLGDVYAQPHDFNEVARFTENGMAYSVKVLDLAVRKNDSELEVGISPFTNCVFAIFKPLSPILGMNSLENRLKWRDTCFRIKSKQAVAFLRPVGDLFRGGVSRPHCRLCPRVPLPLISPASPPRGLLRLAPLCS